MTKAKKVAGQGPLALRFLPHVCAKILHLRDCTEVEVSGFGVIRKEQPGVVSEFHLVKQVSSPTSTEFDGQALQEHLLRMMGRGLAPAESQRVWIHTHPHGVTRPSRTDEETVQKVFLDEHVRRSWHVMFILPKGVAFEKAYCRLGRMTELPPLAELVVDEEEILVEVALGLPFEAVTPESYEAWEKEFEEMVKIKPRLVDKRPAWAQGDRVQVSGQPVYLPSAHRRQAAGGQRPLSGYEDQWEDQWEEDPQEAGMEMYSQAMGPEEDWEEDWDEELTEELAWDEEEPDEELSALEFWQEQARQRAALEGGEEGDEEEGWWDDYGRAVTAATGEED